MSERGFKSFILINDCSHEDACFVHVHVFKDACCSRVLLGEASERCSDGGNVFHQSAIIT